MWAPELETLDQLIAGKMPLVVIQKIFPTDLTFIQGIRGLLTNGDVRLLASDSAEVPKWRWRELFDERNAIKEMPHFWLEATEQGLRRI